MKAFTILTAISSMAVGLQVVLGVPLATTDGRPKYLVVQPSEPF